MDKQAEVRIKRAYALHTLRKYYRSLGVPENNLTKQASFGLNSLKQWVAEKWKDPLYRKLMLGGLIGSGFGATNRLLDEDFEASLSDVGRVVRDAALYGGVGAGLLGGIGLTEQKLLPQADAAKVTVKK